MKQLLILIIIAGLFMSACTTKIVVPKENMTCQELKQCYNTNFQCCLKSIDKPFKNWDCKEYGEVNHNSEYLLLMVKKCSI